MKEKEEELEGYAVRFFSAALDGGRETVRRQRAGGGADFKEKGLRALRLDSRGQPRERARS